MPLRPLEILLLISLENENYLLRIGRCLDLDFEFAMNLFQCFVDD